MGNGQKKHGLGLQTAANCESQETQLKRHVAMPPGPYNRAIYRKLFQKKLLKAGYFYRPATGMRFYENAHFSDDAENTDRKLNDTDRINGWIPQLLLPFAFEANSPG